VPNESITIDPEHDDKLQPVVGLHFPSSEVLMKLKCLLDIFNPKSILTRSDDPWNC